MKAYECNSCGSSFDEPTREPAGHGWRVCPYCSSPDFEYKGVDGSGCVMLAMLVIALITAWFVF